MHTRQYPINFVSQVNSLTIRKAYGSLAADVLYSSTMIFLSALTWKCSNKNKRHDDCLGSLGINTISNIIEGICI